MSERPKMTDDQRLTFNVIYALWVGLSFGVWQGAFSAGLFAALIALWALCEFANHKSRP